MNHAAVHSAAEAPSRSRCGALGRALAMTLAAAVALLVALQASQAPGDARSAQTLPAASEPAMPGGDLPASEDDLRPQRHMGQPSAY